LDEYLYFLIFLFIRHASVGNLINWNFEGKVGFVKDFLKRLCKFLRLKSTSTLELNAETQEYLSHLLQGCLEGESREKYDLFYHLTVEIVEEMERLSL
ncbi:PTS sugar transporter subunit IIC, partial [Streptococcus suis]